MDEQITLDQVEMVEVDETKEKQAKSSIGDVTEAEKELILKEETLAGKIAAAESILKKREEARASMPLTAEVALDCTSSSNCSIVVDILLTSFQTSCYVLP